MMPTVYSHHHVDDHRVNPNLNLNPLQNQMQIPSTSNPTDLSHSAAPKAMVPGVHHLDPVEAKRAKQERYRLDLMEQQRAAQGQNVRIDQTNKIKQFQNDS